MKTFKNTYRFPNGDVVIARAEFESDMAHSPISYEGSVETFEEYFGRPPPKNMHGWAMDYLAMGILGPKGVEMTSESSGDWRILHL